MPRRLPGRPLTVNITGEAGMVYTDHSVSLSVVVADPGEYGSFSYSWNVTGGDYSSLSGENSATLSFVPEDAVNYAVSLTVTDADHNSASSSATVPVTVLGGCGQTFSPFQPDVPTPTIAECDAEGNPDPGPVPAGCTAYFQVSLGQSNMPHDGTVNVFYKTEDGSDISGRDYASSDGDVELTFTYDSVTHGYHPQIIPVATMPGANGGTFSLVVLRGFDADARIPISSTEFVTATIEAGSRHRL